MPPDDPPVITIIALCRRMRREIPRTVASLHPTYQGTRGRHYNIALVELVSDNMLQASDLTDAPDNLSHVVEDAGVTLPVAVNRAVGRATGRYVLICVDGTRLLTNGIVKRCRQAIQLGPRASVAVPSLDLGITSQRRSAAAGIEGGANADALLEDINFPNAPQRVFSVSSWSKTSPHGWFGRMSECFALLIPRERFELLGGYDEAVTEPDGGLANADFYARATQDTSRPLIVLLGEATVGQRHSGTRDCLRNDATARMRFEQQTGRAFVSASERPVQYLGVLPKPTQKLAAASLLRVMHESDASMSAETRHPLVRYHQRHSATADFVPPEDPIVLVIGMHRSGTSFVANQLLKNGFTIPGTPLPGNSRSNPDGHNEPSEIVAWHDSALAALGLSWSALGRVNSERAATLAEPQARSLRALLVNLIGTQSAKPGWVIKDPRICRLLSVWRLTFDMLGVSPIEVFVMRDPCLVARSLAERDGFGHDLGVMLWARHVRHMLDWVKTADDLFCIDWTHEVTLETYLAQRTGQAIACDAVRAQPLSDAPDPISLSYRQFLDDRDLTAFGAQLDHELTMLDRYPGLIARLDRLAGLPDDPAVFPTPLSD